MDLKSFLQINRGLSTLEASNMWSIYVSNQISFPLLSAAATIIVRSIATVSIVSIRQFIEQEPTYFPL